MAESTFRSLFHDPAHYMKAFNYYSSLSAKHEGFARWVDSVFDHKVVARLSFKLDEKEELRVLGIGTGSGEMDSNMLSSLLRRYPRINNRVVEPAEEQICKYKALAQSKAHELQGVNFEWRQQTIDQYRDTDGDGTKFHTVNVMQSIYYADDVDSSLMYVYDLLEPGGKLIVTTITETSGTYRVWSRFPSFEDHLMHFISSADIRSSFDRRNIPYSQSQQKSRVVITKCLDENSEEANLLFDIFAHVVNFKETASEAQFREVVDYILGSNCSEKVGDEVLFNNDWESIIVTKPE